MHTQLWIEPGTWQMGGLEGSPGMQQVEGRCYDVQGGVI